MDTVRRFRRAVVAALLAAAAAVPLLAQAPAAQPAPASDTQDRPLYRIILKDGTALVSFGEFTRVGDRVVFSMPLDSPPGDHLQLVNLPADSVNWETTDEYTAATRYHQYATSRGEADFAVLTGLVAQALSEIALAKDPARKLDIAERTRRVVAVWPMEHYGYRSADVHDMLSLLDGTISDLRDKTDIRRFDFSLVATIQPPTMPLLPNPSATQSIEQVIAAARLSDVPAERITLLKSALAVMDRSRARLPRAWLRRTHAAAQALLDAELNTERRYQELSRATVSRATTAAEKGDVRAVEQAVATLQARDKALGGKRKDQVDALLGLLNERLDAARRLRLMRDQWARKADAFRAYRASVSGAIDRLVRLRSKLDDVKALAGPNASELPDLVQRFERAARELLAVTAPPDLASAHAMLLSSAELGQQAMRTRERAVIEADVAAAWDASSAAAGSILMLAQARQQIEAITRPPELK